MYLSKVDDATTAVGSSAGWFKIDEMGLASNNPDYWANQVLNVCVPPCIMIHVTDSQEG